MKNIFRKKYGGFSLNTKRMIVLMNNELYK